MTFDFRSPASLALALALSALAGVAAVAAEPVVETVYVASARAVDGPGSQATRNSGALRYAEYAVTVPVSHQPGGLSAEFAVAPVAGFDGKAAFTGAVVGGAVEAHGTREAVVLVHGYNTGFDESVRRAGQLAADFDVPASMVLFAWPSGNRLDRYNVDMMRAADASANLEELLRTLADSGVSRIVLLAHSMGVILAVDTLAQMHEKGADRFFAKLGGVALMSPDMALDDFKDSMERLGSASGKVVAYVSKGDWALELVASVTDNRTRLGTLPDPRELAGIRMMAVDVSAVRASDLTGHYAVGGQPGLIAAVNRMDKPDFIGFAQMAAAGGLEGATVERHGKFTYVTLPQLKR